MSGRTSYQKRARRLKKTLGWKYQFALVWLRKHGQESKALCISRYGKPTTLGLYETDMEIAESQPETVVVRRAPRE